MLWATALSFCPLPSRGLFQLKNHEEATLELTLPELDRHGLRKEKIAMAGRRLRSRKAGWGCMCKRKEAIAGQPSRKQEAGSRKLEAGSWKQEAGSRKLEAKRCVGGRA